MFLSEITQTSAGTRLLPLHWLMEANNKTVFLVSLSSWRAEAAQTYGLQQRLSPQTCCCSHNSNFVFDFADIFKRTPSAMCRSCERLHHLETRDKGVDTHISLYLSGSAGRSSTLTGHDSASSFTPQHVTWTTCATSR